MRLGKAYNACLCFSEILTYIKFVFSKKATKIDENFTVDLTLTTYLYNVKSTLKISSIFVAFLENMNFSFRKQLLFWWNSPHVLLKFNNFSEIFDLLLFFMRIWSFNISLYSFSENIPFWPWTKNKNVALGLVTYVTLDFFETLIAENSHCIKFYILFFPNNHKRKLCLQVGKTQRQVLRIYLM